MAGPLALTSIQDALFGDLGATLVRRPGCLSMCGTQIGAHYDPYRHGRFATVEQSTDKQPESRTRPHGNRLLTRVLTQSRVPTTVPRERAAQIRRGLYCLASGYSTAVSTHPNQPSSDEADPDKQSTPAGVVQDLEEEAEEIGASTEPSPPQGQPPAP